MNAELMDLADKLRHEWCDTFESWVDGGELILATATAFGDGDAFPVSVRRTRNGWELADNGAVVMHLPPADSFNLSEARLQSIHALVHASLASMGSDGVVRRRLHTAPTATEVADFISLLSAISAAPTLMESERSAPFRSRIMKQVRRRLAANVDSLASEGWRIPERNLHRCDLWVPRTVELDQPGVATFYVAASTSVANASLFAYALREVGREDIIVAGYDDSRIGSNSTDLRKLEEAGAETVRINNDDASRFVDVLRGHGVPMAA